MHHSTVKLLYKACRLELNRRSNKQANLLIIADGRNRHYTTIKNASKFLTKLTKKKKLPKSLLHKFFQQETGTMSVAAEMVTSKLR